LLFQGEHFINAYHNISNIILHISKQGVDHLPAVLLVAHHDSPVASPGEGHVGHVSRWRMWGMWGSLRMWGMWCGT
jgi:hypothetical protein